MIPLGQPTSETHPHLVKPGQCIPGFTANELALRRYQILFSVPEKRFIQLDIHKFLHFVHFDWSSNRERLFEKLCDAVPSVERHIIVIPSASKVYMTEKIPYTFRQNSNFYYLCGFMEPDSILVIHGTRSGGIKSGLFVPKDDPLNELWDGPRTGRAGAKRLLEVGEQLLIVLFRSMDINVNSMLNVL